MRLINLLGFLTCFTIALAWDTQDHEIFDLVSALQASEGKGTTFYSFLNVTPSATSTEINRMYRKRSLELHPDKNKGVANIQERFSRLGVIANILRDEEKRKRYQHFYDHGVPVWRGTGYYYSRFRPGLGSVVILLLALSCLAQFGVQTINAVQERKTMHELAERARKAAMSKSVASKSGAKKIRMTLRQSHGDDSGSGRSSAGPMVDFIVRGDEGDELPLDESAIIKPSLARTWLPLLINKIVLSRFFGKSPPIPVEQASQEPLIDDGESIDDQSDSNTKAVSQSTATKRKVKSKAR